ncbi:hypothetical protein Tco_0133379 [Tanacetum coccineum]
MMAYSTSHSNQLYFPSQSAEGVVTYLAEEIRGGLSKRGVVVLLWFNMTLMPEQLSKFLVVVVFANSCD